MSTKSMQIVLDYKRDEIINKFSERWELNKRDTVLKIIDEFNEMFNEDEDPVTKELTDLGIGGIE